MTILWRTDGQVFLQECIPVGCGGCIPACTGQGVCVSARGGGVSARRGMFALRCVCVCVCPSMHWAGGYTPRGQNSWHTLVKTLPFRNYVADGKIFNATVTYYYMDLNFPFPVCVVSYYDLLIECILVKNYLPESNRNDLLKDCNPVSRRCNQFKVHV